MSKLETNTIDNISGSSTLNLGDTNATAITIDSGVSTLTIPNGIATGQNYPMFYAYLSPSQAVASSTYTKVQYNTEVFDTNNYYDSSTNYRFTPLIAGKYLVFYTIGLESADANATSAFANLYLNGSVITNSPRFDCSAFTRISAGAANHIVDMNGTTDYLEVFGYINGGGAEFNVGSRQTYFGAYRLGA